MEKEGIALKLKGETVIALGFKGFLNKGERVNGFSFEEARIVSIEKIFFDEQFDTLSSCPFVV